MSIARRTADMTDSLVYRKFKLPLDPSRLTDPKALARFRTAVHHAADITGVALADPVWRERTRSRSVIFCDTDQFDLYRKKFHPAKAHAAKPRPFSPPGNGLQVSPSRSSDGAAHKSSAHRGDSSHTEVQRAGCAVRAQRARHAEHILAWLQDLRTVQSAGASVWPARSGGDRSRLYKAAGAGGGGRCDILY